MSKSFIPLSNYRRLSPAEMIDSSETFYKLMKQRRTIREYSADAIPAEVIDQCLQTAGTAPSGANQQPWHFVTITDSDLKSKIRQAAEEEEKAFYEGRAGDVWLDTLEPLGTNAEKSFLEEAPVLIAIFEQKYIIDDDGEKVKHYYSKESTGIATGLLITALHNAGLATLTHTPSPMNFLKTILERPDGERPFLLLVVGYPADGAKVPDITKKSLNKIRTSM